MAMKTRPKPKKDPAAWNKLVDRMAELDKQTQTKAKPEGRRPNPD